MQGDPGRAETGPGHPVTPRSPARTEIVRVAWTLLGHSVMVTTSTIARAVHDSTHDPTHDPMRRTGPPLHSIWSRAFSSMDRRRVLRFAASFLWADLEVEEAERNFLLELAHELDIDDPRTEVTRLLAHPPTPEDVDPAEVPAKVADLVRQAVLRAIAADGRVHDDEMKLFELLDDLLPKRLPALR